MSLVPFGASFPPAAGATAAAASAGSGLLTAAAAGGPAAAAAAAADPKPWDQDGWVPRTASGKQKSPNVIRGELQRYIDASPLTQTAIIRKMGVNNNSFRRFMDPKTYKDQWSACQNGTYWAAARLLAEDKWNKEQEKKKASKGKKKAAAGTGKRKADGEENAGNAAAAVATASVVAKPAAKRTKADAVALMAKINATQGANTSIVYDSCPELVKKTKDFLDEPGVTKSDFCSALGDINSNSLRTFLMGKKQDQCGNVTYLRAYAFFEKKRIMEGKKKTARRVKNEAEHPRGFSLEKERAGKWVFSANW
mmetsp:Transcript_18260/g.52231  ORF Transcript_18260/g.52231 Transcript_18260/m.52231 type:complete len:309 (-) Transcript_18260:120-1046(-)